MPALAQDALHRRELDPTDSRVLRFACALFCACGALLAWALLRNPASCVAFTLACACMSALLYCDLQHHVLPTGFVGAMLLLALVFRFSESGLVVCGQSVVIGMFIAALLFIANEIHMRIHANDLIGAGDVRLVLPLVIFSGVQGLGPGVFLASLAMGLISCIMLATKRRRKDSFIALAPGLAIWLLAGTLIPLA